MDNFFIKKHLSDDKRFYIMGPGSPSSDLTLRYGTIFFALIHCNGLCIPWCTFKMSQLFGTN